MVGLVFETDKGYMPKPKRIIPCVKGIRLEDVTPELDSKAYAELKNNKH